MPFDLGYPPAQCKLSRPGYDGTSLQEAAAQFGSEEACLNHVMQTRFRDCVPCRSCGSTSIWRKRNSTQYTLTCCGKTISPLAGTLFDHTKIPLRLWFYAMLHFANSHAGVNPGFLQRQLGISYRAAFRMAQRIRFHMFKLDQKNLIALPGQDIEVQVETLCHVRTGKRAHNRANVLFAAREGKVACVVLRLSRQRTALEAVAKMAPGHGRLRTTCYRTERLFTDYGSRNPRAVFLPCYYLDHPNETDAIKGFLSYFLWPFQTHHKYASREHLWLYLSEFLFRYNRRDRSADIYWDMVSAFPNLTETEIRQF